MLFSEALAPLAGVRDRDKDGRIPRGPLNELFQRHQPEPVRQTQRTQVYQIHSHQRKPGFGFMAEKECPTPVT